LEVLHFSRRATGHPLSVLANHEEQTPPVTVRPIRGARLARKASGAYPQYPIFPLSRLGWQDPGTTYVTADCIDTDLPAGRHFLGQPDKPLIEAARVHHALWIMFTETRCNIFAPARRKGMGTVSDFVIDRLVEWGSCYFSAHRNRRVLVRGWEFQTQGPK
jgi:hypothetical protein